MKCEVKSLKGEIEGGRFFSNLSLHPSNFYLAATIKRNFEELGV